ncbi:hypothetical protein CPAV1605_1532 [seawater metagenome]|uniref:Prolipoprotein diacylglyceryl transferase n=1 Tax=seawater metagenome TaxID=1561972 RepID=A0A5E8CKN3_9ZZZZ
MFPSIIKNSSFYVLLFIVLYSVYIICKKIYEKNFKYTKLDQNTTFKLILIIILIGVARLTQCVYYKFYLKQAISFLPCPLNTNGIKNSISIFMSFIIIVLLLKKKS